MPVFVNGPMGPQTAPDLHGNRPCHQVSGQELNCFGGSSAKDAHNTLSDDMVPSPACAASLAWLAETIAHICHASLVGVHVQGIEKQT